MSYSAMGKALVLSVALSACAHGAAESGASTTPAYVQSGGERTTDGPTFTGARSAFLAGEAHPNASEGGQVIVERQNCEVWADTPEEQCDPSLMVRQSITPGYW